jgi:hypothetical protein
MSRIPNTVSLLIILINLVNPFLGQEDHQEGSQGSEEVNLLDIDSRLLSPSYGGALHVYRATV